MVADMVVVVAAMVNLGSEANKFFHTFLPLDCTQQQQAQHSPWDATTVVAAVLDDCFKRVTGGSRAVPHLLAAMPAVREMLKVAHGRGPPTNGCR